MIYYAKLNYIKSFRSFTIDVDANRKLTYNFLLVINTKFSVHKKALICSRHDVVLNAKWLSQVLTEDMLLSNRVLRVLYTVLASTRPNGPELLSITSM